MSLKTLYIYICRLKLVAMKITKYERFIIYPLLLGLLVLFAFFDLDITHTLYNSNMVIARIGELIAEYPFQLIGVYASILLFRIRSKDTKAKNIGFGILFMFFAIGLSIYSGGRVISYTPNYGWNTIVRWIVAAVFALVNFFLPGFLAYKTPINDRKKILAFGIFVIVMWFLILIMMNALKFFWHRPRWRYIITLEGDPDSYFVPVYHLNCNGTLSSNYASFPSGHTMNAISVICISLLGYVLPSWESSALRLRIISYIWAILSALTRIMAGAHFATDVTGGFFFGFLFFDLMSTFFLPFLEKKIVKKQEKTSINA